MFALAISERANFVELGEVVCLNIANIIGETFVKNILQRTTHDAIYEFDIVPICRILINFVSLKLHMSFILANIVKDDETVDTKDYWHVSLVVFLPDFSSHAFHFKLDTVINFRLSSYL